MRLIQVSCAPAQHHIQQLYPQQWSHPLPSTSIDTHTDAWRACLGRWTNCMKLKKRASEAVSWSRSHAMTLQAAAKKGNKGIYNGGQKGWQNQSSCFGPACVHNIAFFSEPTLTLFLGGRETSIHQSPHTSTYWVFSCLQMQTNIHLEGRVWLRL